MIWYVTFVVCLIIVNVFSVNIDRNNVCTTFRAYANLQNDKHCFYNPDVDSTPLDLAKRYGYTLDSFTTTTDDGYIIGIFRLRKKEKSTKFGQPVIIQHGIIVDGVSWMLSGNNSLSFNLVSNGYDLWIPNFRGSRYSIKHTNLSITAKDYWNYSFHEMGVYDLPAVIEKIANITNRNDIIYIGHSMGSTSALIYSSVKPEHAEKYIKKFVLLAPVAFFNNPKGAIQIALRFYDIIKSVLEIFEIYAIGTFPALQKLVIGLTCGNYPLVLICQIIYSFATGLVVDQIRPEILPLILQLYPTGTAVKILIHYVQIIFTKGRFQWFDYGKNENIKRYNSTIPPLYEIEKIRIPTHIFAGKQDFISEITDTYNLYKHLRSPKDFHTYDLAHTDYLYGRNVNQLYKDIFSVIERDTINNNTIK